MPTVEEWFMMLPVLEMEVQVDMEKMVKVSVVDPLREVKSIKSICFI